MSDPHSHTPDEKAFGLENLWSQAESLQTYTRPELFLHHVKQMWRNVTLSPVTSMVSVITIMISLTLLASFFLILENVRDSLVQQQSQIKIIGFLKDQTSESSVHRLTEAMKQTPGVEAVTFRSKEEALKSFREALGSDAGLLDGLGSENPLPASIEIQLSARAQVQTLAPQLEAKLLELGGVDRVQYNRAVATRLADLLRTFRMAGGIGIVVVLLITAFVIANTIKLALYAHRVEIEIMRLVGATDSFVRAPYLLEGLCGGALGGVIALVVVYFFFSLFQEIIHRSDLLSQFVPHFSFLGLGTCGLVLVIGAGVGYFGSFAALQRFMRDETR